MLTRRHARLAVVLWILVGSAAVDGAEATDASTLFGACKQSVTFSTGYGWGHRLSGSRGDALDTETVPMLPRWSIGITDVIGTHPAYRGNVDLSLEGTFLLNTAPHLGSAQGGTAFVRYNWLGLGRFVPYFGVGGGLVNLDYDLETQRDGFNFLLAGEVGVHSLVAERVAITMGYRLQHISNARIASPNLGVDTSFATIGLTYFVP